MTPVADALSDRAVHGRRRMNPSRIFILRPVATTLLMVAILIVGAIAYLQLPLSALPEVAYPDHPGADLLSRRQPRGHHLGHHGAAGEAIRPDAGPEPDVLDEFRPARR